ncbi:MAG: VanW family protein, partial [bacterium]|nr:VanW family protein [bacterium]
DVREDNLATLGINELIGEGVTYFPGSSANRITNIKVGSSKFNGVLLKPGQVFSFGEILGDVGPEQGYTEGRVILEGRQENQYGGGLCQVSSTAFRAALMSGLPIIQRVSHSFAVSYYTAPYGVPGVDATIYYPQVDLKFRNDTGSYILIQTVLAGTTLKFDYYGTKTKSGVIRGPEFISGSNDVNQPSKTIFWRDVVVNGSVVKTDTFTTYYKSAADFPPIN